MFGNWGRGDQADDGGVTLKTFDDFDRLVRKGLPDCERDRMAEAYENLRYSQGHFDDVDYLRSGAGDTVQARGNRFDDLGAGGVDLAYEKSDFTLAQPVMKRAVRELTKHLYKRSPTRSIRDKAAGAVLNEIYKRNGMSALCHKVDELSAVGGFAAFQFAGDDDPKSPVRIHVWGADQLCVWTDPEDHRKVIAVCTLDQVDGRTRATLWTEDTVCYYTTKRDQYPANGKREFVPIGPPKDNPYRLADDPETGEPGRGVIPFTFVHFEFPATEFTTDAPGTNLKELNRYINFGFDDLADGVRYLTKPIGLAEGVDENYTPPAVIRPGMFLNLPAGAVDAGGNGPVATLRYLSPDNGFVAVIWSHLNNYLDFALEMHGVPPSTVRMVLDARSGVSILAEQAPLLAWTEGRRRDFEHYERDAAVMCLTICACHMRNHGHDDIADRLEAAALDPDFTLVWPRLYVDLPGPERDRQDGVRLTWGYASLIDIVQEREDCTREQAWDKLIRVKDDNDQLAALGIDPIPRSLLGPAAGPGAAQPGATDEDDDQGGDDEDGGTTKQLDKVAAKGVGRKSGVNGEPVDANAKADGLSQEGG